MEQLIRRLEQESGLVLLVLLAVVALTAVVAAFRVRQGMATRSALWTSALDAALVGAISGIAFLTLSAFVAEGSGPANFIPFKSLFDNMEIGEFWVELAIADIVANVLLYVPLGFVAALRLQRMSLLTWAVAAFGLSAAIELVQGVVLNRSADITDVITNGTGGVVGYLLARMFQRVVTHRDGAR